MVATVTVAAFSAGSPCPYVDVLVTDAPAGAASVTVTRTHEGRTYKVRGLVDKSSSSAMTVRDYEAPFDTNLVYQAEFTNDDRTSAGFSNSATVRLSSLIQNTVWFHDPLDPSSAVRVVLDESAVDSISRPVPSEILNIRNRSLGVVLGGVRAGVTKVALSCYTRTTDEADRFDALFGSYDQVSTAVVCVRAAQPIPLPRLLIANIPDPIRSAVDAINGGTTVLWTLEGTETMPPAPGIVKALLTYQDFTDFYATYAEFTAAYPSYVDATRDYSVKGI